MVITEFFAENIKKLKVVRITPQGNMVTLTGKNGSGKTAVLDAISLGIEGTEGVVKQIIRDGQNRAVSRLVIDDELLITRTFTTEPNGDVRTNLVVQGKNGERYPTPQKMLDGLMTRLGFDPFTFMRMKPKDQLEQLRGLVKLDTGALDAQSKNDFDARTVAGRELKAVEIQLATIEKPVPGLPAQLIDVSEVADRLQAAITHNAACDAVQGQVTQMLEREQTALTNANNRRAHINGLLQQIKESETIEAAEREDANKWRRKAEALERHERIDTQQFAEEIKNAEATNAQIKKRDSRAEYESRKVELDTQIKQLTTSMEEREKEKAAAIAKAKLPIKGLSFSGNEVIFGGFPLASASSADQLRVSVAIAMAANPKLKVIRISDGSLLDADSLALIAEMAEKNKYQIWIERVDTTGEVGIVMEDGEIAKVNPEKLPVASAPAPAKKPKKAGAR
jgi:ABC-type dipeptide/oligopeptide/nickel transport system ATPase component